MRYPTTEEHDPEFSLENMSAEERGEADFAARMDLSAGDIYRHALEDKPFRVVRVKRDAVVVTNPLNRHPQVADAGTWPVELHVVYAAWRKGFLSPSTLKTEPSTPDEEAPSGFRTAKTLRAMYGQSRTTSGFVEAVEDFVNENWERADIHAGEEWVHVEFPSPHGGEPLIDAEFAMTVSGVCENGMVEARFASSDGRVVEGGEIRCESLLADRLQRTDITRAP